MLEYNPILVYFVTLFVCLTLLMKALRDMCKEDEQQQQQPPTDSLESPLITPEVYVIPVSRERRSFNFYDDSPPSYEVISSPPSYEECCKEVEAMRVSSAQQPSS